MVAPAVDTGEGGQARPPITQEITSTHSKAHLLGNKVCLKLIEGSVPQGTKKEALERPYSKGLGEVIWITMLVSPLQKILLSANSPIGKETLLSTSSRCRASMSLGVAIACKPPPQ